jgi:hypothetical protein
VPNAGLAISPVAPQQADVSLAILPVAPQHEAPHLDIILPIPPPMVDLIQAANDVWYTTPAIMPDAFLTPTRLKALLLSHPETHQLIAALAMGLRKVPRKFQPLATYAADAMWLVRAGLALLHVFGIEQADLQAKAAVGPTLPELCSGGEYIHIEPPIEAARETLVLDTDASVQQEVERVVTETCLRGTAGILTWDRKHIGNMVFASKGNKRYVLHLAKLAAYLAVCPFARLPQPVTAVDIFEGREQEWGLLIRDLLELPKDPEDPGAPRLENKTLTMLPGFRLRPPIVNFY